MTLLGRLTLAFFLLFAGTMESIADEMARDKIAIVAPPSQHAIVHRIEASLYGSTPNHPNIIWVDPEKIEEYHLDRECDCQKDLALIVAVGPKATDALLEFNVPTPILSVLIHKSTFRG